MEKLIILKVLAKVFDIATNILAAIIGHVVIVALKPAVIAIKRLLIN